MLNAPVLCPSNLRDILLGNLASTPTLIIGVFPLYLLSSAKKVDVFGSKIMVVVFTLYS